jgi:hypothetical protein
LSKAALVLLLAALLTGPIQGSDSSSPESSTVTALQAFLREVGSRDDGQIRRCVALVVASAIRLDELEAVRSSEAASFRAVLDKQLRTGGAALNLLGSNSLESVRWELADNLQTSFGPDSRPVDRFLGAVADRESRSGGSSQSVQDTVGAVARALASAGEDSSRRLAIDRLLIEAAAVLHVHGDDPTALESVRKELSKQLE